MAEVTMTYTPGYDSNKKPDVDNMIVNINPTKTPFSSSIGKESTTREEFKWLETTLAKPAENAHLEGADAVVQESKPRAMLRNVCQILKKSFGVSGTMKVISQYGTKKELEHQIKDHGVELSTDIEWNLLNNALNNGDGGTPRKTQGVVNWVDSASDRYFSFKDVPADTNHITHRIIQNVMQGMYEEGAQADTILAMPDQHVKISEFTQGGRITVNADASKKKLNMVVNILETPFGVVTVMPTLNVAPSEAGGKKYDKMPIIQKDLFKRTVLRSVKTEPLGKTGDSEKYEMLTELGLKCGSRKGVGLIVNLTREDNVVGAP